MKKYILCIFINWKKCSWTTILIISPFTSIYLPQRRESALAFVLTHLRHWNDFHSLIASFSSYIFKTKSLFLMFLSETYSTKSRTWSWNQQKPYELMVCYHNVLLPCLIFIDKHPQNCHYVKIILHFKLKILKKHF